MHPRQRQNHSKSKKSLNKSVNKSHSKSHSKRASTPNHNQKTTKRKQAPLYSINISKDLKKKSEKPSLAKKKIEDLKTPDLIIKVSYKGKRVSIPISNLDEKCLKETVIPQIVRFEREVLKNAHFDQGCIENWKTIGQGDPLKDFYFQTNKPISVFKGQVLEIEPIWREEPFVKGNQLNSKALATATLSNFQIIKCIGTGGFSRVFLARYRPTGKFYALKLMEKEGLVETGKQCVVTNERDIMVELNNPYVLNLDFAFETKHFVGLGLQYCPGGELFYYLRKVRRMSEDDARYCFIEILSGIQYLHSKKIIYRDIKPENIMIDEDGNLKIADFGLSRRGIKAGEMAYTYCGSPEYMAPQMLTKSGHSFSVDYYCLGALLYQLVTGNPPFYSRDVQKIYYSIQNQQIDFPPHVELSDEIKMLLEGLLIKDPKRRLGSMGGVREILGHPWVRKTKVSDVINKLIPTPITIDLLTFNINEEEIEEGDGVFEAKLQDEGDDFEVLFEDFYYSRIDEERRNNNGNNNHILDEIEMMPGSVKSDSTKQNKSHTTGKQNTNTNHSHKNNTAKSAMSATTSNGTAVAASTVSNHHLQNSNNSNANNYPYHHQPYHHVNYSSTSASNTNNNNNKRAINIKSSLSREKHLNEKFSIDISHQKKHPSSEVNRDDILKPKGTGTSGVKLKKQKSKKQLNLIQRSKRRNHHNVEGSMVKQSKVTVGTVVGGGKGSYHGHGHRSPQPGVGVERAKSPKNLVKNSMKTLKRIKSSTALIQPTYSELKHY